MVKRSPHFSICWFVDPFACPLLGLGLEVESLELELEVAERAPAGRVGLDMGWPSLEAWDADFWLVGFDTLG